MASDGKRMAGLFGTITILFIAGCTLRPRVNAANPVESDLPLKKGTRWTYSYRAYQPASDPARIETAEYSLTETVIETSASGSVFSAHVKSEAQPVQVPAGWTGAELPTEFWYIVRGQQVYQSGAPFDAATIDLATLNLVFDLPLSAGRGWCPLQVDLKDPNHTPITNCEYGGKFTVLQRSAQQVPAGRFEDCYQIRQFFNDGSVFQWFCRGIGVVSSRFDHNGTRFGFERELIRFEPGAD